VGGRSRGIVGRVLGESLTIGIIGGLGGIVLGFAGAALVSRIAPPLTATTGLATGTATPGGARAFAGGGPPRGRVGGGGGRGGGAAQRPGAGSAGAGSAAVAAPVGAVAAVAGSAGWPRTRAARSPSTSARRS